MERYKIDVAKRVLNQHSKVNIQDLIPILERLEPTIRACYHKYLDLDGKTLAWIIAIDGLFLLGIFSELANEDDIAGKQLMQDDIHRDMVMLENQIPMVSLKAISDNIVHSSSEDGGMMLSGSIFERFCKPISGIVDSSSDHPMDECVSIIDDEDGGIMMLSRSIFERFCANLSPLPFQPINAKYVHLLDLMLQSIVIEPQDKPVGAAFAGQTLIAACMQILGLCIGIPSEQIGKLLEFIQGMPWDKIFGLIGFRKGNKSSESAAAATDENKTSLVDEIKIPSVSELCSAGIKFSHTPWGLWDIKFDDKEGTLDLPNITLNATSEVVLRNLLAYEALSAKSGSKLELASYMDLMSGIIDTAEDARLLREKSIVRGPLTDDEVADLFNGMNMSKKYSTRKPDKESNIERIIEGVNKYYNNKWKVKACNRAKKIVYVFWKVLPVLSTILLILLLSLHSYCNVYGCTHFLARSGSA